MIDITDKKIKTLFFWTLVAMFFATSSALILYSFGYTFSFDKRIFVHSGSITIKTNPQNVNVEINNSSVTKKLNRINNSFHISGVYPGEYILKVSAPGFNTWSKKVSIHSGFSTEFWNVLLTRKEYARASYDTIGVKNFFISPRKNLIATVYQENEDLGIKIIDSGTNEITNDFSLSQYSFTNDPEENIEWSPESQGIIVPVINNSEKDYAIADIETGSVLRLKELTDKTNISGVRWDPENKNIIYFTSDKNLYRLDMTKPKEEKIVAQQISGYDISEKNIYYMQLPGGIIFQTSLDGSRTPEQITMSAPSEIVDDFYKLIVYDRQRLILRNKNDQLFAYNESAQGKFFQKISDEAVGAQFSNDGKKLLFWSNREIFSYFTRNWLTQPYREENEITSIIRFSQPIRNVHWSDDYEHVIFSVGGKIKITETDSRDNRNTFDIASTFEENSNMVNNFSDGKIYFIDLDENKQPILQSIQFPEENGLLTFF
ncbi:MAG: hypothetical protein ACD_11C00108G0040 [uncultured bacterium]|nr:MAG: hypothetical protein ACD_11C00108G0040 [uncultured bacterium]HBR71445.1 hypothetical protein [Candidatus Moranbacteria bacterium]